MIPLADEEIYEAMARDFAPAYRLTEFEPPSTWIRRLGASLGRAEEAERLIGARFAERDYSPAQIRDIWEKALADERPRMDLNFYFHIPFCRQKCTFCYYYISTVGDGVRLASFVDDLCRTLEFYAPAFAGRNFQSVFFGGGTASILTASQLERLLETLFKRFSFDAQGEKCFESDPASLLPEKIAVLKRYGVNKISMGVQSLERDILAGENRGYQSRAMVLETIRNIKDGGDFKLNLDLLLGMQKDSAEDFLRSFADLASEFKPDLTVYPIHPTKGYLKLHYGGDAARYHADLEERFAGVPERAVTIATEHGYPRVEGLRLSDHCWEFPSPIERAEFSTSYNDVSDDPLLLFGLGPSALSRVAGRLRYRQLERTETGFDPDKPIYRGFAVPWRDEMVKSVAMNLWKRKDMTLSGFKRTFGRDLREAFPEAVAALLREGTLKIEEDDIRFTPKDGKERFMMGLRFLGFQDVEELFVKEIVLESDAGSLALRFEPVYEGVEYLAAQGGVGLRAIGDFPGEGEGLLKGLFKSLPDGKGLRELRNLYAASLGKSLEALKDKGHFSSVTLRT